MSTATVRERCVRVNGIDTVVREAGAAASGEAVVFLHGNPGPSEDWTGLMGEVGTFAHAVTWDAPGFGRADKPRDFPHTIDGHAGFVGAMLDELGIRRAHLVLHDFAGISGLAWAAREPERFASAVLINSGLLIGYRWHTLARIWQTPVLGELFMATTTRRGFRTLVGRANPRLPRAEIDRLYAAYDTGTKRSVLRLYRSARHEVGDDWARRTAARLAGLDRPALVVWGAQDAYLPVEQAHIQRRAFPRAEIRILDDHGHWVFLEDLAAVAEPVAGFLRRVVRHPAERP